MWLLSLNQDDTEFIPPREVEEWDVNGCLSLFRYYRAACERWQVGNASLVALQLPKVGNVAVLFCGVSNRRGELSNTLSMKKEVCVCVQTARE